MAYAKRCSNMMIVKTQQPLNRSGRPIVHLVRAHSIVLIYPQPSIYPTFVVHSCLTGGAPIWSVSTDN